MSRKPTAKTANRRALYGREEFTYPEGTIEICQYCGMPSEPLASLSEKRLHRTGKCQQ